MTLTQPPKAYWLIFLIFLASMLHGCATTAPEPEKQGPQVVLTKIEPRQVDGKTEIAIEGPAPILQYTSLQLTEPVSLIVDIAYAISVLFGIGWPATRVRSPTLRQARKTISHGWRSGLRRSRNRR